MNYPYNQTPSYAELYESLAMLSGEKSHNPEHSISTNNDASITQSYLTGYPTPDRRNDAIANRLARQITKQKIYLGKMENIDTLLTTLPVAYKNALENVEYAAIQKQLTKDGLTAFLDMPYLTPNGGKRKPGAVGTKHLRLFKFWFAGCYPCLVQQPHEAELLATHPEVDLIYVAHNTRKQDWHDYLIAHRPPTELQLFVPVKDRAVIRSSAGTTGAPTYVMVNEQREIICRPCPKPNDPLLQEIIEKALDGQGL